MDSSRDCDHSVGDAISAKHKKMMNFILLTTESIYYKYI